MNKDQLKLRHLLERLTMNEISREEFDELFALINRGEQEEYVKALLMEGLGNEQLPETLEQDRLDTILSGILFSAPASGLYNAGTPVRRMIFWRRFAVAAAILLLIGAGIWFGLNRTPKTELATREQTSKPVNDAAPGGNKAILTLGDNSTIVLDSAGNGKLAQQGSSVVSKTKDGELKYEMGNPGSKITYNKLSTPRGGQYQLVLPDGSKVWLNSASSITFPTAFTGNERKVVITGEAYFEVAHLQLSTGHKMPFKVEKGNVTIEVLGTHFNVNAYDDEDAIRTTLLEGKVKVVNGQKQAAILQPGEQALLAPDSALSINRSPDLDEVMAWKNGLFHFENADIKTVMRQLSRWYDIEVEYKGAVKNEPLIMEIPRNTNLSDVLKVIGSTAGLRLTFEGKKVTVL
jgi:ferric-dicitrate binding protein FerR (iron transport regulator)